MMRTSGGMAALVLAVCVSGCNTTVSCSKDTECDDGLFCNGAETCNTSTHKCVAGMPPSCDDQISCTVDICDDATGKCDHIGQDQTCGAGMACNAMSGCVAACDPKTCNSSCTTAGSSSGTCINSMFCQCSGVSGTLSGTALLFGHADNSGITVSLAGTMLTATTAADGTYSFKSVPAGVYSMGFAAPKYLPQTVAAVTVAPTSTTGAPTVTLTHGKVIGPTNTPPGQFGALQNAVDARFTPDRTHAVIDVWAYPNATYAFSFAVDGSTPLSDLVQGAGGFGPVVNYQISNDHMVFWDAGGVWTRPLNASAAASLLMGVPPPIPAGGGAGSVAVIGTVGAFTVIQVNDPSKGATPWSWMGVPSDGSSAPFAIWTQPNTTTAPPTYFLNDDNYVVFSTFDSSTNIGTMHSYNLKTKGDAPVSPGFSSLPNPLGPPTTDHNWLFGYATTAATGKTQVFTYKVAASTVLTTADTVGLSVPGGTVTPIYDSSGFVFQQTLAGTSITAGYWFFGTTVTPTPSNPVQLIPGASVSATAPYIPALVGKVMVYGNAAASNQLHLVSIPSMGNTTPFTTTSTMGVPGRLFTQLTSDGNNTPTGANLVWSAATSPTSFSGTTITFPLTANPTVGQLGAAQTVQCTSSFNGVLSGAFFYQCSDSSTVSSFVPPFSTTQPAGAIDSGVVQNTLAPLGTARAMYHRGDGNFMTTDGATKAVLSKNADSTTVFTAVNNQWVFFFDLGGGMSRVSTLSGSTIDEPLTNCNMTPALIGSPTWLPSLQNSNVVAPFDVCNSVFSPYTVSTSNLP
jgi:hypothetical protein